MIQLSADSRVDTFRLILEMETRGQQIDEILARLKQVFLQDTGSISIPTAVGTLDELRWHVAQINEQLRNVESSIGIRRRPLRRHPNPTKSAASGQLRGTTGTIPVCDLMAMLASQKRTGTLRIKADSDERFVLELLEGQVVHAATDSPVQSQMLGNILVAQGQITEQQLEEFLAGFTRGKRRLGSAMIVAGLVDEAGLLCALEEQVRQLVQRMSSVGSAMFCFSEGPVRNIELRVRMNTMELLLDAGRDHHAEDAECHGTAEEAIADAVEDAVEAARTVAAAFAPGTDRAEAADEVEGGVADLATSEMFDDSSDVATGDEMLEGQCRPEPEQDMVGASPLSESEPTSDAARASAGDRYDAPTLVQMLGIRPIAAEDLVRRGLCTAEAFAAMSDEELRGIEGVNGKVLDRIRRISS